MEELTSWVCRAKEGDRAAYDRIVRQFQDRAVAYGYSVLGDFHAAEDAAQEAFLQAFTDLPSLTEPAAFPGWFRKIVFKFCDRQTRGRRPAVTSLDAVRETLADQGDPAQRFEKEHRNAQVHAAVRSLPEPDRDVIVLFYIGEHSQQEIADFLQVPVTTVKKRLQRARARLQERMVVMVRETLRESAPSRDTRFTEVTALLGRTRDVLERDPRVVAAYLAHFGQGEGWGAEDDAWSSLNVHAVVADEHIDAFATERRAFAALPGRPLLTVEAAQNAPPGGYYLMALYDGEAGPYEVDWYWHGRSGVKIPQDTRLLLDRAGLARSDEPTAWGTTDEVPPALQRVRDAMTEEAKRADEARNVVSLFWAMLLISAKCVARDPRGGEVPFFPMLNNLLQDARQFAGLPAGPYDRAAEASDAGGRLAHLRGIAAQMESLMPQVAARGADVPAAMPERSGRFLDMVEAALPAAGQAAGK